MHSLDKVDIDILEQLQKDATIPMAELAERVGSSKSVIWRRVQRLQDDGIIKQKAALLDREKLGLNVMLFANVKMQAHSRDSLPNFIEQVQKFPEVIECHTLMGDIDFILKIVVKDIKHYETFFWEKLQQIDGVREISSSIALTAVKDTTELSLSSLK